MKSVGNLTDFVRNHMLEPFDVAPRLSALINHFDDLNSAHEAVLKARRQIDALAPLVDDCRRRAEHCDNNDELRKCREALRPFFSGLKAKLLLRRTANLQDDLSRENSQITRLTDKLQKLRIEESKYPAQHFRERRSSNRGACRSN